jgi:hypothetical protein
MSNDTKVNQALEKLVVARIGLLIRHPFFGNIITPHAVDAGRMVSHCSHRRPQFVF